MGLGSGNGSVDQKTLRKRSYVYALTMPELPEVETIRRQLEESVVGKKVASVTVLFGGRMNVSAKVFEKALVGATIVSAGRRAKLLLLGFSNGKTLVTHLKMTGRYSYVRHSDPVVKHTHVVFALAGGRKGEEMDLRFGDVRKFGYVKLVDTARLERDVFDKEGYGPEPLDPAFSFARFMMCARGRGPKRIKPLLMAQTCIAGIGNIYADEACWRAGVLPERRVDSLSEKELHGVYDGVRSALRASVKRRGTSADNFVDLYGRQGQNVPHLDVYGRDGEKCRRCGGTIAKKRFAGRGTHWCPVCQK